MTERERNMERLLWGLLNSSRTLQNRRQYGKEPTSRWYTMSVREDLLQRAQELVGDAAPLDKSPRPKVRTKKPPSRVTRYVRWPD